MKQHQKLTVVLCLIWVVSLLYGEMFAFWVPSLLSCSWPHPSSSFTNSSIKVAVLTDPQLMDKTSLHLPPKSLALEIAQFYTDLFMRRAFFASVLPFKPDVILFLGDYFDGGPYLSDEEWQESLSRFNHIFGLKNQAVQVYYLPGNHDIGYSSLHSHKPEVIRRYENVFGKRNFRFTVGKVEFISIDAQTLDGHPEGNLASTTWDFAKNVSVDVQLLPRVLLTHIPLYRRDWTPCGLHRNSPVINQCKEFSLYMLMLLSVFELTCMSWLLSWSADLAYCSWSGNPVSELHHRGFIKPLTGLDKTCKFSLPLFDTSCAYLSWLDNDVGLKPETSLLGKTSVTLLMLVRLARLPSKVLVLSGHDHDQCTVIHESNFGPIKEHTVGTVSWQQGNLYPSFMLLSASNSSLLGATNLEEAVFTHLCFLPVQIHIYIWYLFLFVLTFLALLVWPTSGMGFWQRCSDLVGYSRQLISCNIFKGGTKEKNEDEHCEYEMIWDAEGSMHLVKKRINTPITHSSDRRTVERGNAVMRARKNVSEEIEVCMNVDTTVDDDDPTTKLQPRTSKSKTKLIIYRLVRTFRMLTFIAAVNVSLYMMLLFKDWIDL